MLLETGTNFTILDTEVAFFFLCHGVHMLLDCPEAIAFNFVLLLGHMLLPEKKVHPTFQCSQFVSAINTLQIIPFQLVCVANSIDASNVSSNYLPSKDSPILPYSHHVVGLCYRQALQSHEKGLLLFHTTM